MEEEVKKILEENLRLNQEIYKMVKSIKSYILWQQIFGFLKVLIIIVPVIIGLIYLPPLLKGIFKQYESLLGIGDSLNSESSGGGGLLKGLLRSGEMEISPELQKYLDR